MIVFGLDYENIEYGYKMDGPHDPENGLLFNKDKILLDPYARAVGGRDKWGDQPNWDDVFPLREKPWGYDPGIEECFGFRGEIQTDDLNVFLQSVALRPQTRRVLDFENSRFWDWHPSMMGTTAEMVKDKKARILRELDAEITIWENLKADDSLLLDNIKHNIQSTCFHRIIKFTGCSSSF